MLTKILLEGEIPIGMDEQDAERAIKEIVREAVWLDLAEGTVDGYFVHLSMEILRRVTATGLPVRFTSAPNTFYDLRMIIGSKRGPTCDE